MDKFVNVNFINKNTVYIGENVKIGNNVTIYENNRIEGNTVIGDNCIIFQNNFIKNSQIGTDTEITNSYIEDSVINNYVHIGPFSRIRPNSIIGDNCKIGNFVEVKNSILANGVKASHLAYIGDAEVGENCNIGCGVIFVNYNGKAKNKIIIGNGCFIGSNCNLIAPLNIGDRSYICAGTTVTESVEADDFVIGRTRQEVKPLGAKKYFKNMENK